VKVGAKHRFMWTSAKLTTATYTVKFLIAGKVFKTTTVKIAAAPKVKKK
jgi:hypothetical protein